MGRGFIDVLREALLGPDDHEEMMDRMHPHGPDDDADADDEKRKAAASHTRGGAGGMKELKDAMEATPSGDTRKNKNAY